MSENNNSDEKTECIFFLKLEILKKIRIQIQNIKVEKYTPNRGRKKDK